MRKLYILFLLFMMSCTTTKTFVMTKPGSDFYNGQIRNSIQQKAISKRPVLLLNDSLITDVKSIKFNLNRLSFDSISSFSIITNNKGQELFNESGKNGIIFVVTKNFLKGIPYNPDTTPAKKVKIGDNPIMFLDNITIDNNILQKLNEKDVVSVEVLKKESSRIYFNDKGNDGVFFITTKNYAIKKINSRFSYLNKDYKRLNAGNISGFEKLMFIENDSLLNTYDGYGAYISKICHYSGDVKQVNVLPPDLARERYKDFNINEKIVVEIIK